MLSFYHYWYWVVVNFQSDLNFNYPHCRHFCRTCWTHLSWLYCLWQMATLMLPKSQKHIKIKKFGSVRGWLLNFFHVDPSLNLV